MRIIITALTLFMIGCATPHDLTFTVKQYKGGPILTRVYTRDTASFSICIVDAKCDTMVNNNYSQRSRYRVYNMGRLPYGHYLIKVTRDTIKQVQQFNSRQIRPGITR